MTRPPRTPTAVRRSARRRRSGGQAFLEFALMLPLLLLVALGATDLARGFYLSDEITGASRAGVRSGIRADTVDIGDAIRSEPNTAIPNSVAAWGREGPPSGATVQPYAACGGATTSCGDPNGCTASSSWQPGQVACFAVRSCKLDGVPGSIYHCSPGSYSAWQQRPQPCSPVPCAAGQQGPAGDGLDVVVMYRFTPQTPIIASFVSSGVFMLRDETIALELYY